MAAGYEIILVIRVRTERAGILVPMKPAGHSKSKAELGLMEE